jgi:hypothetical protein
VLVNPSASFVHVTNRLVEHEAKSILPAFRADYDYFAWLIRSSTVPEPVSVVVAR